MITSLNHITLAVTDVQRSVAFYREQLGCLVRAIWPKGAYLEVGLFWLCLSHDDQASSRPHADYTHLAFSVSEADFLMMSARLQSGCTIWKENGSEGQSLYFLDPDGHRLELHVGDLASRLAHYRANPPAGMQILD